MLGGNAKSYSYFGRQFGAFFHFIIIIIFFQNKTEHTFTIGPGSHTPWNLLK